MKSAWSGLLLLSAMACHRPREMAPQVPLEGIDGKYSFTITNPFKLEGQFLVAQSKAYMMSPRHCVPIEGPKSSDALRASWFECQGGKDTRSSASLRLRISEVDPVNQSRWYQRIAVRDIVERCTAWQNGTCVQGYRAVRRDPKYEDRNGTITVVRGWPVTPDTSRSEPSGRGRLRSRCDTTASTNGCRSGS